MGDNRNTLFSSSDKILFALTVGMYRISLTSYTPDIKYNDFTIDVIGGDCCTRLSNKQVAKCAPALCPANWIHLERKMAEKKKQQKWNLQKKRLTHVYVFDLWHRLTGHVLIEMQHFYTKLMENKTKNGRTKTKTKQKHKNSNGLPRSHWHRIIYDRNASSLDLINQLFQWYIRAKIVINYNYFVSSFV